jgi:hypothetical protein
VAIAIQKAEIRAVATNKDVLLSLDSAGRVWLMRALVVPLPERDGRGSRSSSVLGVPFS